MYWLKVCGLILALLTLCRYEAEISRLSAKRGYKHSDIAESKYDGQNEEAYNAARRKVFREHIHTEEEARFYLAGARPVCAVTLLIINSPHCVQAPVTSTSATSKTGGSAFQRQLVTFLCFQLGSIIGETKGVVRSLVMAHHSIYAAPHRTRTATPRCCAFSKTSRSGSHCTGTTRLPALTPTRCGDSTWRR